MNNKGFSLIELIISVAILTIITSAILGFIITSTKSYGNVSEEVEIQQESQLSLNQIADLVVDSTNGIKYYYNDDESKTILSDADISGDATSKTLAIYNIVRETESGVVVEKKYIYNIIWKKSESKIYLRKDSIDSSTGLVTKGDEALMVEYVTAFSPSLVKVESKKKVSISMSFLRNNKTYNVSKNFALRNRAIVNGNLTDIYDDIQPLTSYVTDVIITHNNNAETVVTLWKQKKQISFSNKVKGVGFPSAEVIWNISGSTSSVAGQESGTKVISNPTGCVVTLGDNEASSSLSLTATSKAMDANGNPVTSNPVSINIKAITGVNLSIDNYNGKLHEGDYFTVKANVSGTSNLTDAEKNVSWSVVGAERDNSIPIGDRTQKYKVTAKSGETISIKATSDSDTSVFGELVDIPVEAAEYKIAVYPDVWSTIGVSNYTVSAYIEPNDGKYGDIGWNILVEYWTPNGWVEYKVNDMNNFVEFVPSGNTAKVYVKRYLPGGVGFKIHTTAYLKDNPDISSSTYVFANEYK